MALNTLKCNHLTPLGLKGLTLKCFGLQSSCLICKYIFRLSGSESSIKVMVLGLGHKGKCQTNNGIQKFTGGLFSVERQSYYFLFVCNDLYWSRFSDCFCFEQVMTMPACVRPFSLYLRIIHFNLCW